MVLVFNYREYFGLNMIQMNNQINIFSLKFANHYVDFQFQCMFINPNMMNLYTYIENQ
jgi:hypothetical protein